MRLRLMRCIIFVLLIASIIVIEIRDNVNGEMTEEWVARYNGPANHDDSAIEMAVDSSGNVYVTGSSKGNGTGQDFVTIAYDSSGNLRWVRRYNGPGNDKDEAHAITLDKSGNVYIIGSSHGGFDTILDYTTIKYDSDGNELWVARYNGSVKGHDHPRAITIGPSGNVYVTGEGVDLDIGHSFTTVAYDQDGNEKWIARYRGNGTNEQRAYDIVCDSNENIFVTGMSSGRGTDTDLTTVAYNSYGHELWVARYNGAVNGKDAGLAITVNLLGNIHVTGYSSGIGTKWDITTIAYDLLGNELWISIFSGPANDYDWAQDIALDSSNNVYITGRSQNDYATIKYDSFGNELWVAIYNGPGDGRDEAYALFLDLAGNVYVAGGSDGNGTGKDYAIVKYNSSGIQVWTARYDGLGNLDDHAIDLLLDTFGNVYVTGGSDGNGTERDLVTIKYSQEKSTLQATIDIDPNTLNLKSKGRWVTCYITLNSPYDVNDIQISTILLENTIPAEWGDIQDDTLMVKFDRSDVEDMLSPGTYNLKVTGELSDGTSFEGYSDEIGVIDPGK
jgi:hypothetical protein